MKSTTSFFSNLSNLEKILVAVLGLLLGCLLCAISLTRVRNFLSNLGQSAKTLSAAETFEVSAVGVVKDDGYTVTSAICEVVSSEHFQPSVNVDGGQIVFHAFRITKPSLGSEVVVLFYSNHTAAQGSGLVFTVNSEASRLFPEFPDASRNSEYPITVNTAGAEDALECAKKAGNPPSLDSGNFDAEAWRREAIKRFGPEQTYPDGSKDDYVQLALSICKYKEENPSITYEEGSDQQYIIETFCPYVK